MCLRIDKKRAQTVSFRLALWNAVFFGAGGLIIFLLVYFWLISGLDYRMDEDLVGEAREFNELYHLEGIDVLDTVMTLEADSEDISRVFYRLVSPGLEELAGSNMALWKGIGIDSDIVHNIKPGEEKIVSVLIPWDDDDFVRIIYKGCDDGNVIQIGMALEDDDEFIEDYTERFLVAFLGMAILGIIGGWRVSRRAMTGVNRVTNTAVSIGRGDFSSRVPLGDEGLEITNLAMAFNDMLERIESLIRELKDVSDNVAHDLRSPLTRMRGVAETTPTGSQDMEEYRQTTGIVIEECDRLGEMINTMLEITAADAGVGKIDRTKVDMCSLVSSACELFEIVAADKDIRLDDDLPERHLFCSGDAARLQRMLANLVDNAIKYTPEGGRVCITLASDRNWIILQVKDSGPGISQDEQSRIFERFYRLDQSRNTPGNGLGLSLVRSIVKMHAGNIEVSSLPALGSIFTVRLPIE